ncbi:MAG: FG-GAP-like repeat-containing protein [Flavobacteriales bacterium]
MKTCLFTLFLCASIFGRAQGFAEIASLLDVDAGYTSGEYGGGVSFVDFNQDGLDDLTFATGTGQEIRFFLNNGNGFTALEPLVNNTSEVKSVLWVDYDNDGDLDLYATARNGNKLYKNTGDLLFTDITSSCGFSDPVTAQSFCASWLDYDHDALPDLIVSFRVQHLVGKIMLYHNLGNDQFEDVTTEAGLQNLGSSVLAMATLDINNDGWEDIFVGQDYQVGCILLKNNGDGTFDNISASSNTDIANNTMTVTIGDYNGDGLMDIYLTDTGAGNSLLRNLDNETFVDEAYSESVVMNQFSWGAAFIDVENDMDVDLHVNRTSGCTTYGNIPDAPFSNISDEMGFSSYYFYSVGLACGDYNNDGLVDLVKNGSNGSPSTFWLNNNTGHNYITVDLHSTLSNSMSIGAVIDVYAGGKHQLRRIGCGEGFSSQNSYSQFFGLGSNTLVEEITVHWPNGLVNTMNNVAVNQRIEITESLPYTGCTDIAACNFDPEAQEDDGSCYYPQTYYDCFGNCMNDSNSNGVCDELEIYGCANSSACNYDFNATIDDGSCYYPDPYYDCAGYCLNDYNGNGICDEFEYYGCMDGGACNYDPSATYDDGSCYYADPYYDCYGYCWNDYNGNGICDEFETIYGCMDGGACNYDPSATYDDGSCYYPQAYYDCYGYCWNDSNSNGICDEFEGIYGCMDWSACNYDPSATYDNGSCYYPDPYYDCNGYCLNDQNGNFICDEFEYYGCMDGGACNYDPSATFDNGSCYYADLYYDCFGNCLNDANNNGICDEVDYIYGCTISIACNYEPSANVDDGSCYYAQDYYDCNGSCLNDSDQDGVCDEYEISGCTNTDACNYSSDATDDDGSCAFIEAYSVMGDEGVEVGYPYAYSYTNTIGSTYQWNVEMGSVTSGQGTSSVEIVFDTEGMHQVSVVETNIADCTGPTAVLNVNAVVGSVLSIEAFSFSIYPNPASDLITIQASQKMEILQIFNLQSQLIREEKINGNSAVIDISGLAIGMYFVKVDGVVRMMAVK